MAQLHTDKPYIVALSLHVWSVQAFLSLFSTTVIINVYYYCDAYVEYCISKSCKHCLK